MEDVYKQLSFFKNKSLTYFEPRIFTFSCEKDDSCSQSLVEEACISKGKYCIMFPHMPGMRLDHSNSFKKNHKLKFFEETLR